MRDTPTSDYWDKECLSGASTLSVVFTSILKLRSTWKLVSDKGKIIGEKLCRYNKGAEFSKVMYKNAMIEKM